MTGLYFAEDDRRVYMPIEEAINRIERVITDNCEELRKKEGGEVYADELTNAWKTVLKG
jgi:hypothetical protein|tara:strand:- start:26 stop:202 length:177 start_codon:yes stop_codon:yes gene_type:complete